MESVPEEVKTGSKKFEPPPEMDDALEVVKKYGPPVAAGVLIAVVIYGALAFQRHKKESSSYQASEMYMTAQSPEQLQAIVDQYPHSAVAPMALLTLASERYHEGQFDLAEMHYRQFMGQHPNHLMRPAAELGLAYCDEARGRFDAALNGFRSFREMHPDHYLAAPAQLGEARVLGYQGRHDEARAIYQAFLDDPDHPWRAQARSDMLYMEKDLRAQQR